MLVRVVVPRGRTNRRIHAAGTSEPMLAGPLRAGPPARPAPAGVQLGVNIGQLFNSRLYHRAEIRAQLSELAGTGAKVVRADAFWEVAEPAAPVGGLPRYDWAYADRIVGALAVYRLRWLPVIDYSPPWVQSIQGVDHSPPASPMAYAAYAGALAARYGTGGVFWRAHPRLHPEPVQTYEIWNEPDNVAFWKPRPDPAAYAQLYLRARVAITAVQPGARVIIGGLTRPATFLPALLSAEPALRGHIDGVGIHPYGPDVQAVLARVRRARQTLRSLGMASVPLYVTEVGWSVQPVGNPGSTPAKRRPGLIFQTLAALRRTDCGLAAVLLYAWFTPDTDPGIGQDGYGIVSTRPRRTPSVRALTAALSAGANRPSAPRLCSGRRAHS